MPSPARIRTVDEAIRMAARDGERLVARTRLVITLGLFASWPISEWMSAAGRMNEVVVACAAAGVAASYASLRWLRDHPPTFRFSASSVTFDVLMVWSILLSEALWPDAHYRGVVLLSGMPAAYLVVAAAGVRFSRGAALLGIALTMIAAAGVLAVDMLVWAHDEYFPTLGNMIGVGFNLLAASLVAWSVAARTRALADESTSMAVVAARAHQRLGAYVPAAVAAASLEADALLLGGRRARVTVLFARLTGLPGADDAAPEERVAELNAYFARMTAAIAAHGGVVDKYLGPGIMAVFGMPDSAPEAALAATARALAAAEAMNEALTAHNRERRAAGKPALEHGIGVHVGDAVAGNVGTPKRVQYTVIGDAVNVAARVQARALAMKSRVLLTDAAAKAIREEAAAAGARLRSVGTHALRGRQAEVELFTTIAGATPSLPPSKPRKAERASWSIPPSHLASGAWQRVSQRAKRVLVEEPERIADTVLTTAALTGERLVAWTRLVICASAIVLAPYFGSLQAPAKTIITIRVIALAGALTSLAILYKLKKPVAPSEAWTFFPVTLDVVLSTLAVMVFVVWNTPKYGGVIHLPGVGLLHLAVILGGLRLRRRHALHGGVLASLILASIVAYDLSRGIHMYATDIAYAFVILGGSGVLAWAIATRTRALLTGAIDAGRSAARARARLGAYVSDAVASHALSEDELELGGRRLEKVATLFCDLRGFTRYAEGRDPEALVAELNAYLEAMEAPILEQQGVIDSFLGDAIVVVFGAPKPRPKPALRAIRAAIGMQCALREHNAERALRGLPPLVHGIGIHVGPVIAGHIGTTERAAFTIVGDVVTVAEALEQATKGRDENVLVSEAACRAAQDEAGGDSVPVLAPLGEIHIGVKQAPIAVRALAS